MWRLCSWPSRQEKEKLKIEKVKKEKLQIVQKIKQALKIPFLF
jgi:hypothetical protein